MKHHILLILHLLAATIWVGGHLVMAITILPTALKQKRPEMILAFEHTYGKIGMPALVTLIVSGIWMAYDFGVPVSDWFSFASPMEKVISTKLTLLLLTFALAISAQRRVIPNLTAKRLPEMAAHIIAVTLIGVSMLILGSTMRYGGI